jgi:hypothetical protein
MVDVARDRQLHPDIEYHLNYQFGAWSSLTEYMAQWPELEDIDREVFQLEWEGITESRLKDLQRWAEEGCLTPHQQARYQELLELVTKNRPLLNILFAV